MADPTTQPGFWGRWRASDLTGANGSAVASWTGSNGVVLAQGTVAAQPLVGTDASGRKFASFDGVDDRLFKDSPGSLLNAKAGSTVYVVAAQPVAAAATSNVVWIATAAATGGTSRHIVRVTAVTGGMAVTAGGRRLDADAFQSANGAAPVVGARSVVTGVLDWTNAAAAVYQDGTLGGTLSPFQTAGVSETLNPLNMSFAAATASGFVAMDFYEVLIYEAAHTPAERAQVHTYIQDTYGITVADYVSSVTLTAARPVSDVATGGWGTAPLWSKLNDSSDATLISGTAA